MLKVTLDGEGTIDNAVIFLEDPIEKFPIYLEPVSNKKWEKEDIPTIHDDLLDYSLHVQAYTGTAFTCVVTDMENDKSVTIEGITGKKIKHYANEKGTQEFQ